MNTEAKRAIAFLETQGISCEHIDLRSINPLDWNTILSSVKKTKRLLVLDTASKTSSLSAEIIAKVSTELFSELLSPPDRICLPDIPVPASFSLTKNLYPTSFDIAQKVCNIMEIEFRPDSLASSEFPHDVPGDWFKGPF
jgi:pyruvate dehydrogenase E1 component beta subunit